MIEWSRSCSLVVNHQRKQSNDFLIRHTHTSLIPPNTILSEKECIKILFQQQRIFQAEPAHHLLIFSSSILPNCLDRHQKDLQQGDWCSTSFPLALQVLQVLNREERSCFAPSLPFLQGSLRRILKDPVTLLADIWAPFHWNRVTLKQRARAAHSKLKNNPPKPIRWPKATSMPWASAPSKSLHPLFSPFSSLNRGTLPFSLSLSASSQFRSAQFHFHFLPLMSCGWPQKWRRDSANTSAASIPATLWKGEIIGAASLGRAKQH